MQKAITSGSVVGTLPDVRGGLHGAGTVTQEWPYDLMPDEFMDIHKVKRKRKSYLVEKMDHVRAWGWGAVWFFPLTESSVPGSAENQDHVAWAESGGGGGCRSPPTWVSPASWPPDSVTHRGCLVLSDFQLGFCFMIHCLSSSKWFLSLVHESWQRVVDLSLLSDKIVQDREYLRFPWWGGVPG